MERRSLEGVSSRVTDRVRQSNPKRIRSDGSTPIAEGGKRPHSDGIADKKTNRKIGDLSNKDVLKAFKINQWSRNPGPA